jgi:ankyrin repeat protein
MVPPLPTPPPSDPLEALVAAIRRGDSAGIDDVLNRHAELKGRLNEPFPGAPFGQTPLLAAVASRNRDAVDALLRHGADINGRSHWWAGGFGVLDDDGHDLHDFLIARGAAVNAYAAARLGRLDTLRGLLDSDPGQVHFRGGDGQTPLHVAADVETAALLLDRGADPDALDVDHESTPAQYAIRDRRAVAAYLVSRGCRTDLLLAAALGDIGLMRKHLDADPAAIRVNVSERYFPMRNPRAGGTIYIWTLGKYKTAHQVARDFGRDEVLRFLLERSPAPVQLVDACESGDEGRVDSLLAAGAGPEAEDHARIAMAAVNNNAAAVGLMLRAGWPADGRAQHGGTALHWGAFHGNAGMTRELLRHGASVETRDFDFKGTALDWALHGANKGAHSQTADYVATARVLLEAGATHSSPAQLAAASAAVQELFEGRPGE